MKTWLFNPFKFIAGSKALAFGMAAIVVTALLAVLTKEHLDGVLDIHVGRESASYVYFTESFIDWLSLVFPLYIFGRILSTSSIRLVDVAGTSALARYPMFFVVIVSMFIPKNLPTDPQKLFAIIQNNPGIVARLVCIGLLTLPFIIWTVALMYNAYSISANLKGAKAVWSFIASVVIAEIISKIILYLL